MRELANQENQHKGEAYDIANRMRQLSEQAERTQVASKVEQQEIKQLGEDMKQLAERDFEDATCKLNEATNPNTKPEAAGQVARATNEIQRKLERTNREINQPDPNQVAQNKDSSQEPGNNPADAQSEQESEAMAQQAQGNLDALRDHIEGLRGQVKELQSEQKALTQEAEKTTNNELDRTAEKQNQLEIKAVPTLEDVQRLAAGETPRDLSEGASEQNAAEEPGSDEKAASKENPAEAGKTEADPNAKGEESKQDSGESPDSSDDQVPSPPGGEFETLKKQRTASEQGKGEPTKSRQQRGRNSRKGRGQPSESPQQVAQAKRQRLDENQQMLTRDLGRAEKMLTQQNDQVAEALEQLEEAEGQAGKLSEAMKTNPLRKQLSLAERMTNSEKGQPSQQATRGTRPFEQGFLQGGQLSGSSGKLDLEAEIAKLRLQSATGKSCSRGSTKKVRRATASSSATITTSCRKFNPIGDNTMTDASNPSAGGQGECPVCEKSGNLGPSYPGGPAICGGCGEMLGWFRHRYADKAGLPEDRIRLESNFVEDLSMDSLDQVELIMELEDEFKVKIADDEAERLKTVGDAIRYIQQHRGG